MSIILFIFIILIIHFFLLKKEHFKLPKSKDIELLYQMLYDTDKILTRNNLNYYIDGGTLLGAVRHKGIIPWDDDGDICIFKEDEKKLLNLSPYFLDLGYKITSYWGGYKIYPINGKEIQYKNANWGWFHDDGSLKEIEKPNYKFPFIDVSIISKKLDKFHYNDSIVKNHWPNCFHYEKDLLDLKRYNFNEFTLLGPKNPSPYLERCYGKDWNIIGKQKYDHLNMKFLDNVINDLNKLNEPACKSFRVKK